VRCRQVGKCQLQPPSIYVFRKVTQQKSDLEARLPIVSRAPAFSWLLFVVAGLDDNG
jgi:hypothetical protein